jgi:hypothetical protein
MYAYLRSQPALPEEADEPRHQRRELQGVDLLLLVAMVADTPRTRPFASSLLAISQHAKQN